MFYRWFIKALNVGGNMRSNPIQRWLPLAAELIHTELARFRSCGS